MKEPLIEKSESEGEDEDDFSWLFVPLPLETLCCMRLASNDLYSHDEMKALLTEYTWIKVWNERKFYVFKMIEDALRKQDSHRWMIKHYEKYLKVPHDLPGRGAHFPHIPYMLHYLKEETGFEKLYPVYGPTIEWDRTYRVMCKTMDDVKLSLTRIREIDEKRSIVVIADAVLKQDIIKWVDTELSGTDIQGRIDQGLQFHNGKKSISLVLYSPWYADKLGLPRPTKDGRKRLYRGAEIE